MGSWANGGAHAPAAAGRAVRIGPVERESEVTVTFALAPRDRAGLVAKARSGRSFARADVENAHRPEGAAVRDLLRWCAARGLRAEAGADGWLVEAKGAAPDVERALGVRLDSVSVGRVRGRLARGEPDLPPGVAAVLGLSDLARPWRGRPHRPGGAAAATGPASGPGYLPADIRLAYGLPDPEAGLDGQGESVAVLEFGSAFQNSDLSAFWQRAGVRAPRVESVWAPPAPPRGAPSPPASADVEATADVEWVGALAPGARVVVVNALVGEGAGGFAQALARALVEVTRLDPRPSVVSISWGDAEAFFAPADLAALDWLCARAAAMGVTVVAASGDSGAYGVPVPVGPLRSVDAPACLSHVLAVGGTRMELADGVVARELGWSDGAGGGASGGGVSAVFPVPPWQDATAVAAATGGGAGRGVPDVAADADPDTGYRMVLGGRVGVVGGTSLAAPVWAAALTLVNQARRRAGLGPVGLAAPALYPLARPTRVRDILVGDNAFLSAPGYRCRPGWDAVTGLGSPAGPALWQALAGGGWPAPTPAREVPAPPALPEGVRGPTGSQESGEDAMPAQADGGKPAEGDQTGEPPAEGGGSAPDEAGREDGVSLASTPPPVPAAPAPPPSPPVRRRAAASRGSRPERSRSLERN
ncbi:MAG: S8 family serine peptidase, partial [Firmicutes bacterium]|nr:S8 family serine peptidase [Bacillota bacterium]